MKTELTRKEYQEVLTQFIYLANSYRTLNKHIETMADQLGMSVQELKDSYFFAPIRAGIQDEKKAQLDRILKEYKIEVHLKNQLPFEAYRSEVAELLGIKPTQAQQGHIKTFFDLEYLAEDAVRLIKRMDENEDKSKAGK